MLKLSSAKVGRLAQALGACLVALSGLKLLFLMGVIDSHLGAAEHNLGIYALAAALELAFGIVLLLDTPWRALASAMVSAGFLGAACVTYLVARSRDDLTCRCLGVVEIDLRLGLVLQGSIVVVAALVWFTSTVTALRADPEPSA